MLGQRSSTIDQGNAVIRRRSHFAAIARGWSGAFVFVEFVPQGADTYIEIFCCLRAVSITRFQSPEDVLLLNLMERENLVWGKQFLRAKWSNIRRMHCGAVLAHGWRAQGNETEVFRLQVLPVQAEDDRPFR